MRPEPLPPVRQRLPSSPIWNAIGSPVSVLTLAESFVSRMRGRSYDRSGRSGRRPEPPAPGRQPAGPWRRRPAKVWRPSATSKFMVLDSIRRSVAPATSCRSQYRGYRGHVNGVKPDSGRPETFQPCLDLRRSTPGAGAVAFRSTASDIGPAGDRDRQVLVSSTTAARPARRVGGSPMVTLPLPPLAGHVDLDSRPCARAKVPGD